MKNSLLSITACRQPSPSVIITARRHQNYTSPPRSVFPKKLLLSPLQSRWETSQPPPPLSAGIIVASAVELLMLPEFAWKYECFSLELDIEERRDEKKRFDHLKQDQTMLVIKIFSERKKVFRERKKTGKIRAKRFSPLSLAFTRVPILCCRPYSLAGKVSAAAAAAPLKYECFSLELDIEERRDEKKRFDHLKQDQTMLVIKIFSERKKVFRERKKTGKIRAKRVMDPNSSLGKICLGEDVVVISSDKIEGSRDWNSLEFQDTAKSGKRKETKDMYAVKLCLEHEVKRGNKVVKKEFIVALRGEIYFVKFIINLEEDDVEPGEEGKRNDDWDHLLDFNIDDIPLMGEEGLPPFVCKMRKSSRNKKRAMENLNVFYQDIGTSSSAGGHLTQEEEAKEAIAIHVSQKFSLLEEERLIIETMAYHDKYKKILDEVWKDKVELDGKIVKEDEEAVKRIKGETLKEKDDPGAFM
ncbi:hypothetical protein Tco_1061464 [Tanacetum coccineum]